MANKNPNGTAVFAAQGRSKAGQVGPGTYKDAMGHPVAITARMGAERLAAILNIPVEQLVAS